MGGKYVGNKLMRGVSDLIIVLALISVAIPVTIAVQHWLSSQVGRVTAYSIAPKVTASLVSMDYRGNNFTAVVKVVNRGVNELNLSNINVTALLSNGTTTSVKSETISGGETLSPNGEATMLLTIPNIDSKVVVIVLEFKDVSGSKVPVELVVS